jgi:hypothetical protein
VLVSASMVSRRGCSSMSPLNLVGKDVAREGQQTSHQPLRILHVKSIRGKI